MPGGLRSTGTGAASVALAWRASTDDIGFSGYEIRYPQGLDFDSQGRLRQAEFGNSVMDEVDLIRKGGNCGCPACEGTSGSCSGYIAPKKTWATAQASPSGLTIINDPVFVATTRGERVYRMCIDTSSNLVEQKISLSGHVRPAARRRGRPPGRHLAHHIDRQGRCERQRQDPGVDIVHSGGAAAAGAARGPGSGKEALEHRRGSA
ncbi:PQQ-dependent sugar dehydrogenase [Streptomyces sp. Tu 2975]|uniref:PQQ-dependent sugar dehydrogenase n=1 Tax=Streptomyces sp. Tu 2975 TaxID=2676871 RepID=UPI001FC9BFA4|nr:PQQ-dependent sugar dehydrogenase [Streptomyces sp. Tu 2975]